MERSCNVKQAECKCSGVNHIKNIEKFRHFEYENKVT